MSSSLSSNLVLTNTMEISGGDDIQCPSDPVQKFGQIGLHIVP